jgi:hypothetical protein
VNRQVTHCRHLSSTVCTQLGTAFLIFQSGFSDIRINSNRISEVLLYLNSIWLCEKSKVLKFPALDTQQLMKLPPRAVIYIDEW